MSFMTSLRSSQAEEIKATRVRGLIWRVTSMTAYLDQDYYTLSYKEGDEDRHGQELYVYV